jgi:hypothetical protein
LKSNWTDRDTTTAPPRRPFRIRLAASEPFRGSIFRIRDPDGVLNRFGRKRFELESFAKEAREILLEAAG